MIIFKETKKYDNLTLFVFENEYGSTVEIPFTDSIADFFLTRLNPLISNDSKHVEFEDEQTIDE